MLTTLLCAMLIQAQDPSPSMAAIIRTYRSDEGDVSRIYDVPLSEAGREKLEDLYKETERKLETIDFPALDEAGKADWLLLRNAIERKVARTKKNVQDEKSTAALLPFGPKLVALEEARRRMDPVQPEQDAQVLDAATKQIRDLESLLGGKLKAPKFTAYLAAQQITTLQGFLKHWFGSYNGYDPVFTWWVANPYKALDDELTKYAAAIKEKLAGIKPEDTHAIVGNPIGRDALLQELKFAVIPYTPEELIAIADKQYAWCEAEMKKASRELGFKDDWRKALEHVKDLHVQPGEQPALIKELALEAIKFVEDRDLVTVPELAKESWKMEMMSPERQLVSPFFLGGEDILVSYPTDAMTHEQKLMSMRGNNRYFARATVQHELIPGHHLQDYYLSRFHEYREAFYTPFWVEGWALYWEMLLWDLGFAKTPEERIGMLFWRMHRCVRIEFSLKFHLGQLTPEQCVDLLVQKVGHERANAEGEVRRSLNGDYEPLYQAAYMLGGLQIRALHHEIVDSGKMTSKQFHDAILRENTMPIELLRAVLTNQPLTKDFKSAWRFAD